MRNTYKKLTTSTIKLNLGVALVFLVFFVIFAGYYNRDFTRYMLANKNFQKVAVEDLSTKKVFYACNNNTLYDCFAAYKNGQIYITDIKDENGNTKYMGFYVSNKHIDKADKICDEMSKRNFGSAMPETHIKGKGVVRDMTQEEIDLFNEYFDKVNPEIKSQLVYKMFIYAPYTESFKFPATMFGIMEIFFLIATLVPIINVITGHYKYSLMKYAKTQGLTKEELIDELDHSTVVGMFYCCSKFLTFHGFNINVIDFEKITEVKPEKVHGTNGNQDMFRARIVMTDRKKPKFVPTANLDTAYDLCKFIHDKNPSVKYVEPPKPVKFPYV